MLIQRKSESMVNLTRINFTQSILFATLFEALFNDCSKISHALAQSLYEFTKHHEEKSCKQKNE